MAFEHDASFVKDQFQSLLADAVVRVKTEEDPLILNEYKKIFKQNVPLSLRSYVAAYLAKGLISGGISVPPRQTAAVSKGATGRFDKSLRKTIRADSEKRKHERPEKASKKEPNKEKVAPAISRVIIDEDKAATIFIGIGRNRGVYARDLIGLVAQRASIDRERIGDIRVLDNYSFVQVYAEDADNAINLLNGTDFRNRKLTVSYAHKKEDGEATEQNRFSNDEQSALNSDTIDNEMTQVKAEN